MATGDRRLHGHPAKKEEADDAIETELSDHRTADDIVAAVVLEATPKNVRAVL